MNPERWQEVEDVLHQALDRPDGERTAFLATRCAHDQDLLNEVQQLIGYAAPPETNADQPLDLSGMVRQAATGLFSPPQRVGAYRIVKEIGRGGMGTVYLAEREGEFRQQAAIKLVTRGMDTAALLHRFRNERQILARLEHPNIARLLDGGSTEEGRPYLVMEYVAGSTILHWCDERKLGTRERVELFRKVCAAVQYAHQNLVVHRDLKPANILVDESGAPKLLDFGIAKLLQPEEGYQTTAIMGTGPLLTPDYASPEQVRGDSLGTATDVYSLGAILYELLTGIRPHRISAMTPREIERAVCEEEVLRPSAAPGSRLAPGDLDSVLLKALEKDIARRYGLAAELEQDLVRYLEGRPVVAREPTLLYRARRFVRRNWTGVAAAVVLAASIGAGVVSTMIQARRAERLFADVRGIAKDVLYDLHDAVRDLPGATKAREIVVNTSLRYLDRLRSEKLTDPTLLADMADAYLRVAEAQGAATSTNLGKKAEAVASAGKGIAAAEELVRMGVETPQQALVRMGLYRFQGYMLVNSGNSKAASADFDRAIAIGEDLVKRDGNNKDYLRGLASAYRATSDEGMDSARGLAGTRRSLELSSKLVAVAPQDSEARWQLGQSYNRLGMILHRRGELKLAVDNLRKGLDIVEAEAAADPTNAIRRQQVAVGYSNLGDILGNPTQDNLGDRAGALAAFRKSLAANQALMAADANDQTSAMGTAIVMARIANVTDNTAEALRLYRQSRDTLDALVKKDERNGRLKMYLAYTLTRMSDRLRQSGDSAGALETIRSARQLVEPAARKTPPDLIAGRVLIEILRSSAEIQAQRGDRSAIQTIESAIPLLDLAIQRDRAGLAARGAPRVYASFGQVYADLARHAGGKDDWGQAAQWYEKSVAGWKATAQLSAGQKADQQKAEAGLALTQAALAK